MLYAPTEVSWKQRTQFGNSTNSQNSSRMNISGAQILLTLATWRDRLPSVDFVCANMKTLTGMETTSTSR